MSYDDYKISVIYKKADGTEGESIPVGFSHRFVLQDAAAGVISPKVICNQAGPDFEIKFVLDPDDQPAA